MFFVSLYIHDSITQNGLPPLYLFLKFIYEKSNFMFILAITGGCDLSFSNNTQTSFACLCSLGLLNFKNVDNSTHPQSLLESHGVARGCTQTSLGEERKKRHGIHTSLPSQA